jgi:protein gp37
MTKRTGTSIEWTDHTHNLWRGCKRRHTGCLHCYAECDRSIRCHDVDFWGERRLASAAYTRRPRGWNRDAALAGVRTRVMLGSLMDFFEDWDGPMTTGPGVEDPTATMDSVRRAAFELIDHTPHLDWIIPTKRPENINAMWPNVTSPTASTDGTSRPGEWYRPNVWLLASVSDQETFGRLGLELLEYRPLVPVIGLSVEPLVGPIDWTHMTEVGLQCSVCDWVGTEAGATRRDFLDEPDGWACPTCGEPCWHWPIEERIECIDWLVIGGESGPKARPCDLDWIRSLVKQGREAGVPTFVKQLGSQPYHIEFTGSGPFGGGWPDAHWMRTPTAENQGDGDYYVVSEYQLTHKKGGDPAEWPEPFPREFPELSRPELEVDHG